MFKGMIILCFALLSLKSWGWSGREVWPKASREQKLFLLEEYRIFFSKNSEPLADWRDKKTTFMQFIQHAYADELSCVFGGWPSKKVGELCAPPSTHNPAYQAGSCGADKMQCQPLFFGAGLCVPVATQKERNLAFNSCMKSFKSAGKTYDQILEEVEGANKQVELLSLLDFADKACQTGFQAPQLLCRRLEAVVMGLKKAIENTKESEQVDDADADAKVDAEVATGDKPEPEVSSETPTTGDSNLVDAANAAANLNATVQGASQLPTNCPPGDKATPVNTTATQSVVVNGIYGPAQALADINSGELTFVGRDLFQNSEERSCVYKSQSAFVIYHNCMADRREHPITNIEVISFSGQAMRFYVENTEAKPEISTLTRASYDNTWSINFKQGPALAAGSNLADLKNYHANLEADFSGSCWIGETGGAKGSGNGKCHGKLASQQSGWAQSSESFWRQPSESWSATKKLLREKVRTSRF